MTALRERWGGAWRNVACLAGGLNVYLWQADMRGEVLAIEEADCCRELAAYSGCACPLLAVAGEALQCLLGLAGECSVSTEDFLANGEGPFE